MKKRVFCLLMSVLFVLGSVFSFNGVYKGDIVNGNNQPETMQKELISEEIIQEEKVSFEYPITPDDEEWNALGSVQDKIEACRIPTEILDKMTDEQLVQAIIDFPFLCDVFLASTESAGVKSLERTCDAYRELLTRTSAKDSLLNQIEHQLNVCATDVSAEQMLTNDALVVLILHQDDFAGELTAEDICNLAELSSQIDISEDVKNGAWPYVVSAPQTPSGVSYYTYTCAHGPVLYHETLDQNTVNNYNVALISSGSCKYNCHSYAWHSRLTTNTYWIPNPAAYMADSAYSQVLSGLNTSSFLAGEDDVVFYGYTDSLRIENAHSAVLISGGTGEPIATRYVYSKWGRAGVFKHIVATVPEVYDTSRITVWSK